MQLVRERLTCEIFDLHNHRHRLLAHLYCIYKSQTLLIFHDQLVASENFVEKTVKLKPLVEIQSRTIIQTVTEENCQLLHIVELASDGVLSVTPISYILDALKETNIEAGDLYKYYGDVKNGNTNLLTSSIHVIFNNLDNYPQMYLVFVGQI